MMTMRKHCIRVVVLNNGISQGVKGGEIPQRFLMRGQ